MNIKRSIMGSYIVVILIPIIIAAISGIMIVNTNKEAKIKDYASNTLLIEKYSKILSDPNLYKTKNEYKNLIEQEDKNLVDIILYNHKGNIIYSSNNKKLDEFSSISKSSLFQGLYERKYGMENDSIKEAVFEDDAIIGIYEIIIHRLNFVNNINNIIISGILFFLASLILLFVFANRFTEKWINKPIQQLVYAMNEFANDRYVKINSRGDDEIGEIISNFNSMRDEIMEKNYQLKQDHAERDYMVMAISHDLKTPLTAIRTNVELMRTTGKYDTERLDGVLEKCDHMKTMLNNLMNYNMLQSGAELDLVVVEGVEAMDTILFGYKDLIEAENLKPYIDIHIDGFYEMDVEQMDRVLGNLVTNAVKYCKKGGNVTIGVYSEEYELPDYLSENIKSHYADRKGKLLIFVRNNAEKMSDNILKKIAYPFYKSDKSRGKEQGSMGLGLSIVVLIIDKHGGDVDFYSEDDNLTIVVSLDRKI